MLITIDRANFSIEIFHHNADLSMHDIAYKCFGFID